LLVLVLTDFDPPRSEPGLVEADLEALDHARLDILGATAGSRLRQIAAEPGDAAEALPFAAIPAIGAANLAPLGEPDQGRHDLDLEAIRYVERRVVDAPRHGLGKSRVVLGVEGQSGIARQIAEHRRRHHAGRAI